MYLQTADPNEMSHHVGFHLGLLYTVCQGTCLPVSRIKRYLDHYTTLLASDDFCHLLITFANSLGPDQNVRPNMQSFVKLKPLPKFPTLQNNPPNPANMKLSAYNICCSYSKTPQNTLTMRANAMNPDQTAPLREQSDLGS